MGSALRPQPTQVGRRDYSASALRSGSPSEAAFADASSDRWYDQQWRDKVAAGFTVSGSLSGDKVQTLQYIHALAMQHGMIWIGLGELPAQANGVNRLGSWIGAMGISGHEPEDGTPGSEDLLTAEALGRRVAAVTARFG